LGQNKLFLYEDNFKNKWFSPNIKLITPTTTNKYKRVRMLGNHVTKKAHAKVLGRTSNKETKTTKYRQ
jgi:hypothetical protein